MGCGATRTRLHGGRLEESFRSVDKYCRGFPGCRAVRRGDHDVHSGQSATEPGPRRDVDAVGRATLLSRRTSWPRLPRRPESGPPTIPVAPTIAMFMPSGRGSTRMCDAPRGERRACCAGVLCTVRDDRGTGAHDTWGIAAACPAALAAAAADCATASRAPAPPTKRRRISSATSRSPRAKARARAVASRGRLSPGASSFAQNVAHAQVERPGNRLRCGDDLTV